MWVFIILSKKPLCVRWNHRVNNFYSRQIHHEISLKLGRIAGQNGVQGSYLNFHLFALLLKMMIGFVLSSLYYIRLASVVVRFSIVSDHPFNNLSPIELVAWIVYHGLVKQPILISEYMIFPATHLSPSSINSNNCLLWRSLIYVNFWPVQAASHFRPHGS